MRDENGEIMGPGGRDYKMAGLIINDLLKRIGVTKGKDIFWILKQAKYVDLGNTEVNGDTFNGIDKEGRILVGHKAIGIEDVEWIRLELYCGDEPKAYDGLSLMYIYLPLNDARDGININGISFDIYPDPDTDDYFDSVAYRDCVKSINESRRKTDSKWTRLF